MTDRNSTIQSTPKQVKKRVRKPKYDTASYIARAVEVHGNKFNYEKTVYKSYSGKVVITCPIHGDFNQSATSHLCGNGCRPCSNLERIRKATTTQSEFIAKAKAIHGNLYSYEKTIYKNGRVGVVITCSTHGDFTQRASTHLIGRGCRKCGKYYGKTTKQFIKQAREVHGDRYSYEKTKYKTSADKLTITCKIHGDFQPTAGNHLSGSHCYKCSRLLCGYSRSDFKGYCDINNNGNGTLYILRCYKDKEVFYKVGITSKTVSSRYAGNTMPYDYDIVYEVVADGSFIYDIENRIISLLGAVHYTPDIDFKGSVTECFTTIKPIEQLLKKLSSTEQLQLIA